MRSIDIRPGSLYAVDHRVEGHRPASHVGELFPRWQAEASEHLGRGRWIVRLVELDQEVEVRSAAIEAPWDEYTERVQRRRAARDRVLSTRLTWEQLTAGEPCPGCGRPYRDNQVRVLTFTNAVDAVGRLLDQGSLPVEEVTGNVLDTLTLHRLVEREGSRLVATERARQALAAYRVDEGWRKEHVCPPDSERGGWHGYAHGPTHCGGCCPPPPLSPEQLARIAQLLSPMGSAGARRPS